MRAETIGGLRVAYERAGEGPPLVLLHGILGDSRDWRTQVEDLQRDFTVIAWDAPGCGGSSDPTEDFGVTGYVDTLTGLLEVTGTAPAHILGLSWGGVLAQEFYRSYPQRVRSLVLADTYAGWLGSLPAEVAEERLASCLRESEMAPEEFVPGWIPGLLTEAAPQELRDEVTAIMSEFHPVGYRAMAKPLGTVDTSGLLPEIRVPTLLVWGADDQRSPLSVGEGMRDAIPGARLVVIPGAGHVSNMEQPALFNAAVREFCLAVDAGL